MPVSNTPYRGLPRWRDCATIEQAMSPGLTVEECVRRLKRYHYGLKRLHEITNAPHHGRVDLRAQVESSACTRTTAPST
jgi:hypothetical protein